MNIRGIVISLIRNKRWLRIQMYSMLVILAGQTNYTLAAPQTSSRSAPVIKSSYDKFKDETMISAATMLEEYDAAIAFTTIKEFISLIAFYFHKGQQPTSPPSVVRLQFQSQATEFRFGRQTELLSIIDGERVAFGKMIYTQQNFGAGHFEVMGFEMPLNTYLKLAHAKTVELRIGQKELQLSAENLASLSAIADRMMGKPTVPRTSSGSAVNQPENKPSSNPAVPPTKSVDTANSTNKCPIEEPGTLVFRGLKFGMSPQEVSNRFPGVAPTISRPDNIGVSSMVVTFGRPNDASGSSGLGKLGVKFLDERVYNIEAVYSLGKEWGNRPRIDFANSVSKGLSMFGTWIETPYNIGATRSSIFKLDCGAVQVQLKVIENNFDFSDNPRWGDAFLTLTDTKVESVLPQRREKLRQQEQQKDAEKRKVFRP